MSPMQPVQVRRGLVWAAMVAMLALPAATWFAGGKLSATSNQTDAIQAERAANILRSCRELNDRHDDTIHAIDRLTLERITNEHVPAATPAAEVTRRLGAALKAMPREGRVQVEQSRKSTAVIIDALAPKKDCGALVALQAPSAASPDPK